MLKQAMNKMPRKAGEQALIERIRSGTGLIRSPFVRLGIGDDCAVLRPPTGCDVVVTTDFTLEGRHFRRDWHTAESAGHRCLARGLSDLAAMGAQPMAAFLSLALPKSVATTFVGRRWVDGFFAGLRALGRIHRVELAGGDVAESPEQAILADIVLVGAVPRGRELRRSGARPGDRLYVTGALGGAAAELETLRSGTPSPQDAPHPQTFPEPRVAVGRALLKRRLASACLDLSDGLSTDLAHLCRESDVCAVVKARSLPLHPLAAACGLDEGLKMALNGGEDYELLFTAPASVKIPRLIAGVKITEIGWIEARANRATVMIDRGDGRLKPLKAAGWEHFRG